VPDIAIEIGSGEINAVIKTKKGKEVSLDGY
jgi:hypothetical protein